MKIGRMYFHTSFFIFSILLFPRILSFKTKNLFPKIDKNHPKKIAGLRPAPPPYQTAPLPSTQVGINVWPQWCWITMTVHFATHSLSVFFPLLSLLLFDTFALLRSLSFCPAQEPVLNTFTTSLNVFPTFYELGRHDCWDLLDQGCTPAHKHCTPSMCCASSNSSRVPRSPPSGCKNERTVDHTTVSREIRKDAR